MARLAFTLTCFAFASLAVAAPVPKGLKVPKKIELTGPRPLLIRTAVVEDGELKLTGPKFPTRPDDLETRSKPLAEVIATTRVGNRIGAKELAERLKKPVVVVVVPFEDKSADPYTEANLPTADTEDDWRRVLADDVMVIDGKAFEYGWWGGQYDVRLDPVSVNGPRVTTKYLGMAPIGNRQFFEQEWESTLDPNELLDVDADEWAEWVRWNERYGMEVDFKRKDAPDEHRALFRREHLDRNVPHFNHRPASPHRIHGGIM